MPSNSLIYFQSFICRLSWHFFWLYIGLVLFPSHSLVDDFVLTISSFFHFRWQAKNKNKQNSLLFFKIIFHWPIKWLICRNKMPRLYLINDEIGLRWCLCRCLIFFFVAEMHWIFSLSLPTSPDPPALLFIAKDQIKKHRNCFGTLSVSVSPRLSLCAL